MITQKLTRFQSPPRLNPSGSSQRGTAPDLSAAEHKQKDGVSWGGVAAGLGLATLALTGCAEMMPEAPPAHEIEAPELVVLSESTHKIDLSREQKTECVGEGAFAECLTEDVAYHPVGIHLGEGVVQDLNGNLFAAPQLLAEQAPGASATSPEFLEAHSSYGAGGVVVEFSEGAYTVDGNLFGQARVFTGADGAQVQTPGVYGAQEHLRVHTDGESAAINEGSGQRTTLREHRDHLSVENEFGRTIARIRHDEKSGQYSVERGDGHSSVSYNDQTAVRRDDGWTVGEVERTAGGDLVMKSGPHTVLKTSVREGGWSDQHSGPFGARIDYSYGAQPID